jgi:Na+-transporting methylmalonyl-CoA/oxaloacetate decarboxylase beta subunit
VAQPGIEIGRGMSVFQRFTRGVLMNNPSFITSQTLHIVLSGPCSFASGTPPMAGILIANLLESSAAARARCGSGAEGISADCGGQQIAAREKKPRNERLRQGHVLGGIGHVWFNRFVSFATKCTRLTA